MSETRLHPGLTLPDHNHCVPYAFAVVKGMDQHGFEDLCRAARATLTACGAMYLLSGRGLAWARGRNFFRWAEIAGLSAVDGPSRPAFATGGLRDGGRGICTAAQFARKHPHGLFILFSRNHAMACVDGLLYGYVKARAHVQEWYEVLP